MLRATLAERLPADIRHDYCTLFAPLRAVAAAVSSEVRSGKERRGAEQVSEQAACSGRRVSASAAAGGGTENTHININTH